MIRWKIKRNGRQAIGLGLEAGNVERLMNGQPILVKAKSLGIPFDIIIHYGKTPNDLVASLAKFGLQPPPEKEWKHD